MKLNQTKWQYKTEQNPSTVRYCQNEADDIYPKPIYKLTELIQS